MNTIPKRIFVIIFLALLLLLLIQDNSRVVGACIDRERDALLEFKKGDESECLSSWSGTNCCGWVGVKCSNITGHVVSLFLGFCHYRNGFPRGEINPSLLNLEYLEVLDLSFNSFSGIIPSNIGSLKHLEYLNLDHNNITGPIPTSIGLLSKLKRLDFSQNNITGPIPTSIGLLSKLEILDVSINSLSGIISEHHFAKFQSLEYLYLYSNKLTMNVSHEWAPPFQLKELYLGSCIVGPEFPSWLQTQRSLTKLDLSSAGISDTIPSWFERTLSSIEYLDLSQNEIGGKLPEIQASNMEVILHSNKFERLFEWFPSHIQVLDLSNNFLSGHFPPISDGPLNIRHGFKPFILANNNLSGPIPECLCTLVPDVVDLSSNQLSGELNICFGNIGTLQVLDLSNNSLHGQIPSNFCSGWGLLVSLHLSNNRFHGELPLSLQKFSSLETLDLSKNAFTGFLPQWVNLLNAVKVVNLQSNNFFGDIPETFCKLKHLQLLHLGENNISGTIPPCFGNFTAMTTKDSLGQPIAYIFKPIGMPSYGNFQDHLEVYFRGLNLRYSSSLPFLISMDLSSNNIVGNIPPVLMNLLELKNLNLSGNHLEGKITENVWILKQLESLDLSRNKLSGAIPMSLSSLSFLSHLNLSYNNLSGRIPTGNQLQTLDDPSIYMGNNQLCGKPLKQKCPGDVNEPSEDDGHVHSPHVEDDDSDRLWFYAGIGPGFLVGFLGFCSVLHFCKSWRHAFFMFFENGYNWLFVQIRVTASLLRRKFHKRQTGLVLIPHQGFTSSS